MGSHNPPPPPLPIFGASPQPSESSRTGRVALRVVNGMTARGQTGPAKFLFCKFLELVLRVLAPATRDARHTVRVQVQSRDQRNMLPCHALRAVASQSGFQARPRQTRHRAQVQASQQQQETQRRRSCRADLSEQAVPPVTSDDSRATPVRRGGPPMDGSDCGSPMRSDLTCPPSPGRDVWLAAAVSSAD